MSVSVRTHHYRATYSKPLLLPYQILYRPSTGGHFFKTCSQAGQTLPAFMPGDQPGSAPQLICQLPLPCPGPSG